MNAIYLLMLYMYVFTQERTLPNVTSIVRICLPCPRMSAKLKRHPNKDGLKNMLFCLLQITDKGSIWLIPESIAVSEIRQWFSGNQVKVYIHCSMAALLPDTHRRHFIARLKVRGWKFLLRVLISLSSFAMSTECAIYCRNWRWSIKHKYVTQSFSTKREEYATTV